MSEEPLPNSEIILYQTEDGRTRIQCRFENETVWLTQALLAELFEIGVNTVNYPVERAALLPEGAGYLRDERGLQAEHGDVAAVFRHGAKQDALGGARANGGGGDP